MSTKRQRSDSDTNDGRLRGSCDPQDSRSPRSEERDQRPAEWIDDGLDRSPASASPFSRPNENSTTKIRGREYDEGTTDGRDLETRDSPKRGDVSGRRLGSCISKSDCDSARWERLRKRDEEILTFDSDRYDAEGDAYMSCHRGAGVETDGDDRIRAMTLLTVVSNVADDMNADSAAENRARTLVAGLDESETNGRKFEATATASLVVARDEFVATRIHCISDDDAEGVGTGPDSQGGPLSAEIQQIQNALERATSPAERFRVLNNLRHVTDDERVQRLLQRRLVASAEDTADAHGFVLKTAVEAVEWSP